MSIQKNNPKYNGYIKAVRDTAMYLFCHVKENIKDEKQAGIVTAKIINEIAEEFKKRE